MLRQLSSITNLVKQVASDIHAGVADLRAIRQMLADQQINSIRRELSRDDNQLTSVGHGTFSQTEEDGLLAEIFRRINATSRRFVEIGVGNGLENNTAALLLQGWTGLWLEGDPECVRSIQDSHRRYLDSGKLRVKQAFVTAENVESLLDEFVTEGPIDLLSIDIDRNTYWIWRALQSFQARVVVVEYNASMSPHVEWVVPYAPEKVWNGSLYFGASLKSFERLGTEFGYSLVGCDVAGVNAFFVRQDLCGDKFTPPFTAERHYQPPRYYLSSTRGAHPPCVDDAPHIGNGCP